MKEQELRKIVEFVCNGYVDTIMENIEDRKRGKILKIEKENSHMLLLVLIILLN